MCINPMMVMPMGFMPTMSMPMPFMPQPLETMPPGVTPTAEVQQEFSKMFLISQKQQIMQTKKYLADYQTLLDESLNAIDKQLSKFSEAEAERKTATEPRAKQSSK